MSPHPHRPSGFNGYYGFIGKPLTHHHCISAMSRDHPSLLWCLGVSGFSPGNDNNSIDCLPTSNTFDLLRKGLWAFVYSATPPRSLALQRFTHCLGCSFGLAFLQIPHWLITNRIPLQVACVKFLRAPLALPIRSLLSGPMSDFHGLVVAHTGRTEVTNCDLKFGRS